MPTILWINELDTNGLGFKVEGVPAFQDGLTVKDPTVKLPGRGGDLLSAASGSTADPRSIVVTGIFKQATLALLESQYLALKAVCAAGLLELRFADDLTKVYTARLGSWIATPIQPQFLNPYRRITIQFVCHDPARYQKAGTIAGFGTVRRAMPLGTAPSSPMVRLMGPATNPSVIYRDATGQVRCTMGFTITLNAADYLEIDCDAGVIAKSIAGVWSPDLTIWTTFADGFVVLDPTDGDPANGLSPSLEVSAGTGEALYKKAYT